ncbi:hypothetical protein LTR17_007697 [Elasticomyces elasticus]|nr:hypothetical protein LTR17_007697 [Elasticomyces elasticus]
MDEWSTMRAVLNGLDADTAELIIQLHIQDTIQLPPLPPQPEPEQHETQPQQQQQQEEMLSVPTAVQSGEEDAFSEKDESECDVQPLQDIGKLATEEHDDEIPYYNDTPIAELHIDEPCFEDAPMDELHTDNPYSECLLSRDSYIEDTPLEKSQYDKSNGLSTEDSYINDPPLEDLHNEDLDLDALEAGWEVHPAFEQLLRKSGTNHELVNIVEGTVGHDNSNELDHDHKELEPSKEVQNQPSAPEPVAIITCVECTACTSRVRTDRTIMMPCNHPYCIECLEDLYNSCMTSDVALFPPRCCRVAFPWELVDEHLSRRLQGIFPSWRVEQETQDKTYCPVKGCSTFIPPDTYFWGTAVCPSCGSSTCVQCKNPLHNGACTETRETGAVRIMAKKQGWQECPGCRSVVELNTGCNHITCLCTAQFCYSCGKKWKTCGCEQWNEDLLLQQARVYVNNNPAAVAQQDELDFGAQVADAIRHLRLNHDCTHERFRGYDWAGGVWNCGLCGYECRDWIKQCRGCRMMICNRCKHNRLR